MNCSFKYQSSNIIMFPSSSLSFVEFNLNAFSFGLSLSMMCAPSSKSQVEVCVTHVLCHRLYGIATLQVFLYYTVYGKSDNHLNKGFVSLVNPNVSINDAYVLPGAVHLVPQNFDKWFKHNSL